MNSSHTGPQAMPSPHPIAQLWRAIAARWASHLEAQRKAHEFDFTVDLSADTLRDIGAPEQLISQATMKREAQQQRLWDLRQWRGG